jgi:hypothetical protein
MGDEERDPLAPLTSSRRAFVKKMVAAGFAAPLVGSFGFAELASAACPPHQSFPNQTHEPPPPPTGHYIDSFLRHRVLKER